MNRNILKSALIGTALTALSACGITQDKSGEGVTIYPAKTLITVAENSDDTAGAVAIKDGLIVGVGSAQTLAKQFSGAVQDDRFAGKTLVPGLIDPHVHTLLGAMMYGLPMAPPWDVETQNGTVKGLGNQANFLAKVAEINAARTSDQPLVIYGFHNLVHGEITKTELDKISPDKPLVIWHYSGHDFYFNSKAIKEAGYTPALAEKYHGVDLTDDGELTGRIYEDAAMVVFNYLGPQLLSPGQMSAGYNGFETILKQAGVTSIAEMGYGIFGGELEDSLTNAQYTQDDSYRLFLVPEHRAFATRYKDEAIAQMQNLVTAPQAIGTPRALNQVKLFTDAAFYSQTMKLRAPGYVAGQSKGTDGLWVTQPEDMQALIQPYWDAGMDIHIHSNGDQAQDATIAGFRAVKENTPGKAGQRLIIEHAGLLRPSQLDAAAGLGIGLSAASHYVHYMGDTYAESIGDRVQYITPLASAAALDMPVTLHSDAPLAPPRPLQAAAVHITRSTRQGGVSTPSEALTKAQALKAITLDAAWSLGMEDELGSIEVGKRADITVLEANPMETDGADWADIPVWGVMIDGEIKAAN